MKKVTLVLLSQINGNKIYTFNLPDVGEPNFYREVSSYDAFCNNLASNTYEFMQKEKRAPRESYYIVDERRDPTVLDGMILEGAEFIDHYENVWGLYKAIGYDRKKRRVVGLQP